MENREEPFVKQVFIKDGMDTEFAEHFNLSALPSYILIDKSGDIVDANLRRPSERVEEMIRNELQNSLR